MTGVYLFYDKCGRVIYVGKAANLEKRIKSYFQKGPIYSPLKEQLREKISRTKKIKTASEIEALLLEANLIKKYQPKFNLELKDDKQYFYLGISKEDYPFIFISHQKSKKIKAKYFGPYTDGGALKETLKFLRKIFPYRSCRRLPKKACLFGRLKQCPGPCVFEAREKRTAKDIGFEKRFKKDYQQNIKNIVLFLQGRRKGLIQKLKKEMKNEAKKQNFEKAAQTRDQVYVLEKILEHKKVLTEFKELKESLIPKQKIEGYDISNIGKDWAVGSMVRFENGRPNKNMYRKFKIKTIKGPNDPGMISEILRRRLSHPEWPYPDVILIDGGKTQLKAAQKILKEFNLDIPCFALAKPNKPSTKNLVLGKLYPKEKKFPLKLAQKILAEAHRFAKKYHRHLREKINE